MATEVIYARVPVALKQAADAYAGEHGKSLAGAVADLLGRGLDAVSDDDSIQTLRSALAQLTSEKAAAELQLNHARAQLATLSTLAHRARQGLGTCPQCRATITGHDLLAAGHCPNCGSSLADLIAPTTAAASTLDQREMLLFIGALGAVLAVAYLASGQ
jgi:phage tail sheath gpL-like